MWAIAYVMNYKVPILNLQEQFSTIAPELEAAALSVLRSGNYILGEKCLEFEKEMAKLCGCNMELEWPTALMLWN